MQWVKSDRAAWRAARTSLAPAHTGVSRRTSRRRMCSAWPAAGATAAAAATSTVTVSSAGKPLKRCATHLAFAHFSSDSDGTRPACAAAMCTAARPQLHRGGTGEDALTGAGEDAGRADGAHLGPSWRCHGTLRQHALHSPHRACALPASQRTSPAAAGAAQRACDCADMMREHGGDRDAIPQPDRRAGIATVPPALFSRCRQRATAVKLARRQAVARHQPWQAVQHSLPEPHAVACPRILVLSLLLRRRGGYESAATLRERHGARHAANLRCHACRSGRKMSSARPRPPVRHDERTCHAALPPRHPTRFGTGGATPHLCWRCERKGSSHTAGRTVPRALSTE